MFAGDDVVDGATALPTASEEAVPQVPAPAAVPARQSGRLRVRVLRPGPQHLQAHVHHAVWHRGEHLRRDRRLAGGRSEVRAHSAPAGVGRTEPVRGGDADAARRTDQGRRDAGRGRTYRRTPVAGHLQPRLGVQQQLDGYQQSR